MKNVVVIPARLNSTRLKEKLLQSGEYGKTILEHTIWNILRSNLVEQVVVATSDKAIYAVMDYYCYLHTAGDGKRFPGKVRCELLPPANNGTDIIHKLVQKCKPWADTNIINVQADEPNIPIEYIEQLIRGLDYTDNLNTIAIPSDNDHSVNVVVNNENYAMYFSREKIPSGGPRLRHLGIYGYKADFFLHKYGNMRPGKYSSENLEQLRWIENEHKIRVHQMPAPTEPIFSIDTQEDLDGFRNYLINTKK